MYTHAHLCVPKHLSTAPPWNSALTSRAHSPGPTNKSPPGVKRCFAPVLRKGGMVTQYLTSHLGACQHPGAIRGQGDFVGRSSCLAFHRLPGKAPLFLLFPASLAFLQPSSCHPKESPQGEKRQGDDYASSSSSSPTRWSPAWGWADPQASAGALPWRVLRVICPPITGSRQHGHLRLASRPRHQAALAASASPSATSPPLQLTAGMAGLSLPLPCPQELPPAHSACLRGQPHRHTRPCEPPPPPSAGTGNRICHVYLHKEEETEAS